MPQTRPVAGVTIALTTAIHRAPSMGGDAFPEMSMFWRPLWKDATRQRAGERSMVAVLTLLVVVAVSVVITRIASTALMHTGLSRASARFQARSAFTGVGFTTSEAERVVNHPVRRRILMLLMLTGNAGLVTAVSSLVLGFVGGRDSALPPLLRGGVLAAGLGLVLWLANSAWIDQRLSRVIRWALGKYTRLEIKDYASLLHLASGYRVSEMVVGSDGWMTGRKLRSLDLSSEGVHVLGIQPRSGKYRGILSGETRLHAGDTLVVYGPDDTLRNIEQRTPDVHGQIQHNEAAVHHRERCEQEGVAGDADSCDEHASKSDTQTQQA